MHGLYSFAVIAEGKEFLLAASSEEEKYKWVEVRNEKTNFSEIVIQDQREPKKSPQQQHLLRLLTAIVDGTSQGTYVM